MTDVITLFKEAAAALQKDPRYLDLDSARAFNDKDEELQRQIGDFNLARIDLNAAVSEETRDDEKINSLNDRVNQLYLDIMQNESMVAYNEAKTEIDALLQYINAIIGAAVNGEDPMQVEEPAAGGCSGSCSSCGGCH